MKILVTGGAGFIGSAFARNVIENTSHEILVVDSLTYAGNESSLASINSNTRFNFLKSNIADEAAITSAIYDFAPHALINFAAETHVDRSIDSPRVFLDTNIIGTFNLLNISRQFIEELKINDFKFIHISTDEVFGDLALNDLPFNENTPYNPHSPYSASKAASDHLVRAWIRTYNFPAIITNCSNNYGPFHHPEKLIPHSIIRGLLQQEIPLYGNGLQIRDWLFVEDHVEAILCVLEKGNLGETYLIGGSNERNNLEVVTTICNELDNLAPLESSSSVSSYADLITFVEDRPGHDQRYAIDSSKLNSTLGWRPKYTFESGISKTVEWYINNTAWWKTILDSYSLKRQGQKL